MTAPEPGPAPSTERAQALAAVEERIARATRAAGRPAGAVGLLAVSKTQPAEAVAAFYALGQRAFGENYAQELAAKAEALKHLPDLRWSFIGTVQSNKLKLIVTHAAEIQSLASLDHARKAAALARSLNKTPFSVYMCVNAGDEATKHGAGLEDAPALAAAIASDCPELKLEGLMAIPPPGAAPALYARLAALAATIGAGKLSLGMSGDLEAAVAAGSTLVRIGTALFGARPKKELDGER